MIIETAGPDDASALAILVNAAYRGASAAGGWTHEAGLLEGQRTDPDALRDAMAAGSTILIMREEPGAAPAACVMVEPKDEHGAWYLGMLTVDPGRQADGLGRTLLDAGETFARQRGGRRIELTVIQLRTGLIAWYERRGYRLTERTAPFPYSDERFGRPLRPDLHFVVLEKEL